MRERGRLTLAVLGLAAGCVHYQVRTLPSGERAYQIRCSGNYDSMADCTSEARSLCAGPFRVLESDQHDTVESRPEVGTPIASVARSLEIVCERPRAPPAPTSSPPVAAVLICRSDHYCGPGNVCAIAPGAFQGVCARAENENGDPTVPMRKSNSAGLAGPACSAGTDCPIGFSCVTEGASAGGSCIRP
jgi:hypothetical protein